ncbi:hypothetical protein GCM10020218_034580 [Dactylosporangium vinaceum]
MSGDRQERDTMNEERPVDPQRRGNDPCGQTRSGQSETPNYQENQSKTTSWKRQPARQNKIVRLHKRAADPKDLRDADRQAVNRGGAYDTTGKGTAARSMSRALNPSKGLSRNKGKREGERRLARRKGNATIKEPTCTH